MLRAQYSCPYCGRKNSAVIDQTSVSGKRVVYCELDGGGCDRMLVLEYYVCVQTSTKALVEEMEDAKREALMDADEAQYEG
jgi:hypothetical protein